MSHHVWIDKDAPTDTAKLQAHGITRCYFDARSVPPTQAGGVSSTLGYFERGIYRVQSWDNLDAATFAWRLSEDVFHWGGDPHRQLAVHANIELHAPAYLVAFLKAWRALRPYRETALVIEGLQGGWFTDDLRAWLAGARDRSGPYVSISGQGVDVLAEAYTGSMGPLDADDVRSNLIDYGVSRSRALVMYDAARLSPFWDGCAFTQQRLP